jgi:hypothetical protein
LKTRIILATGTAVAAGLVGAGGASALVNVSLAPTTSTTTAAVGGDSSNGADNGIHDTNKVVFWDCENDTETSTQPSGDFLKYDGPKDIWPPNHKYRNLTISATDADGGEVMLTVTGSSDETVDGEELNGAGNTDADYIGPDMTPVAVASGTGTASTPYQVRGERSGRGDGRTYSFLTLAEFEDGSCTHTFTATVPHDQRNHTNSGPKKSSGKKLSRKRARRLALARR